MREKYYQWFVLFVVIISVAMIFTDQTILPVALPTIERQFHSAQTELQWMVNAYILALATLMIFGGKLGDIWGHRKMFCLGMFIFAFASATCGFSFNSQSLIISRVVQGLGAAFMIPASQSILLETFPERKRGMAMGICAAVGAAFLTLGPFLGGILTQYLSWRYVFFINIPLAIIGLISAMVFFRKSKKIKESIDFFQFSTFALSIVGLISALMEAKNWGWFSFKFLSVLLFSFVFFLLFILLNKKRKRQFIDFSLFKKINYLSGSINIFAAQFCCMVTVFWVIYFQNILGFSPSKAGIVSMISAIPVMIMAPIGGKLADKKGLKVPVVIGLMLLIFSFVWFSLFIGSASIVILFPSLWALGNGVTFVLTPSFSVALGSVEKEKRGQSSGLLNTIRSCGGTLGVAVLGSLLINVEHNSFSSLLKENPDTRSLDPNLFEGLLSKTTKALDALGRVSQHIRSEIFQALSSSYLKAIIAINITSAAVIAIALFIVIFLFRNKRKKMESDYPPL